MGFNPTRLCRVTIGVLATLSLCSAHLSNEQLSEYRPEIQKLIQTNRIVNAADFADTVDLKKDQKDGVERHLANDFDAAFPGEAGSQRLGGLFTKAEALANRLVATKWLSNNDAVKMRCVISYMFLARQLRWGEEGEEKTLMNSDDAEALWNTINPLIILNIKNEVVTFCEGLVGRLFTGVNRKVTGRVFTDGEKIIIENLLKDDFLNEFYPTKFIETLPENKFDSLDNTLNEYCKISDIVCKECHGRCKAITSPADLTEQFANRFPPPQRGRQRTRSAPAALTSTRDPTPNPFGRAKVHCPACNGVGFSDKFRARILKFLRSFVRKDRQGNLLVPPCSDCKKSGKVTLDRLLKCTSLPTDDCERCQDTGIDLNRTFSEDVHAH